MTNQYPIDENASARCDVCMQNDIVSCAWKNIVVWPTTESARPRSVYIISWFTESFVCRRYANDVVFLPKPRNAYNILLYVMCSRAYVYPKIHEAIGKLSVYVVSS